MTLTRQTRTGVLHLHFGYQHGKTVLLRDLQKAPLMIIRPFELPCGTLMVFIVNPTGGVLGGDHSEVRVQVDAGAQALVLTQSATRIQPALDGKCATQDILFTVAEGARLEYYPERTIPFARSRFQQSIRVQLSEGAAFGATETLASGRVHSGERLALYEYTSRVEVWQKERRLYLDHQKLIPGAWTRAPGVWGNADYAASGVWVGAGQVSQWPTIPGELATGHTHGGATWLRAVSSSGPKLDTALHNARESLRSQLFGAPPLRIRR